MDMCQIQKKTPHDNGALLMCRHCRRPKPPPDKAAPVRDGAAEVPVPMGASSDWGDSLDGGDSGTKLSQDKEAAARQILGMLQMLGANTPLERLKAAGLHGLSLSALAKEEVKPKEPPGGAA